MSFCYLLNAVLLFTGVLAFIIAGFAGTFSTSLRTWRYRLMLAPLGFLVVGSLARSITHSLLKWFQGHGPVAAAHAGTLTLGSGSDIFESIILVLAGVAGMLAGIALGSSLDRAPSNEQTYTIANYWRRSGTDSSRAAAKTNAPVTAVKATVIPISSRRNQPGVIRRINAISKNE